MANINLNIAFWDYDRTHALVDGTVKIDGVDGAFHSAPIVTEIFRHSAIFVNKASGITRPEDLNGHTVVFRRDVLVQHPELSQTVYKGFCDAKKVAEEKYRHGLIFNSMGTMFPWFSQLVDEDVAVLGEDW